MVATLMARLLMRWAGGLPNREHGAASQGDRTAIASVAGKCGARLRLRAVASSARDQRVVEHRVGVVLAHDGDELVPGAGVDDPLVVELRPEALGVGGGERVPGAVHAAPAVAAADDCDELAMCSCSS